MKSEKQFVLTDNVGRVIIIARTEPVDSLCKMPEYQMFVEDEAGIETVFSFESKDIPTIVKAFEGLAGDEKKS